MSEQKNIDEITETVRQSVIDTKSKKHCVRDFTGEVFELTSDMRIQGYSFDKDETSELAGVAECILRKYAKLLCFTR